MGDIILQQKAERDEFLAKAFVPRRGTAGAAPNLATGLATVITGPRRAGKSIFAFLLLAGKDFAYLNFDDDALLRASRTGDLLHALFEVYPDAKWILFDEIQNLEGWELLVSKLLRRGRRLVVTGSNARLLGKDLATALTGRHLPIEVLPFGFDEFLAARAFEATPKKLALPEEKGRLLGLLDEYLRTGGFPEVVVNGLDVHAYLGTLFDSILFTDVVKRWRVKHAQRLYDLAVFLVAQSGSEFSLPRLQRFLGFKSPNTVMNYLAYLEEAYLFFFLRRFSHKMRESIKAPRKVYTVDTGLQTAKAPSLTRDIGHRMENVVFLHLLRRRHKVNRDIFYYRTRGNREVDFLVREGAAPLGLVQVCYDPSAPATREREVTALLEAGAELKCGDLTILTWNEETTEKHEGRDIRFVPLWKWLLSQT